MPLSLSYDSIDQTQKLRYVGAVWYGILSNNRSEEHTSELQSPA